MNKAKKGQDQLTECVHIDLGIGCNFWCLRTFGLKCVREAATVWEWRLAIVDFVLILFLVILVLILIIFFLVIFVIVLIVVFVFILVVLVILLIRAPGFVRQLVILKDWCMLTICKGVSIRWLLLIGILLQFVVVGVV